MKQIETLIIDDQVALASPSEKKQFINRLAVKSEPVHFADSCEEAITKIRKHNNIKICFIDCILPYKKNTIVDYSPDYEKELVENGIKLLPELLKVNSEIAIFFISSNLNKADLLKIKKEFSSNERIIACIHKTESQAVFKRHFQEALAFLDKNKTNDDSILNYSSNETISIKKDEKTLGFDYEGLDYEEIVFIKDKTNLIKTLFKRTTQDIFDIGKSLNEVKEKLPYGSYELWLEKEFSWSTRTAVRFTNVYLKFRNANLSDLPFCPSILYELSGKNVPDEAIEETIQRNKAGENISLNKAKEIKEKYLKKSNSSKKTNIDKGKTLKQPPETTSKQTVLKVISKEKSWTIGNHKIFCEDPNSQAIVKQLPEIVSLCLSFPSDKSWQNYHLEKHRSYMSFYSEYNDVSPEYLLDLIKQAIETVTDYDDYILINFIPHLGILKLFDQLKCKALVIDPDYNKCLELFNASKSKVNITK